MTSVYLAKQFLWEGVNGWADASELEIPVGRKPAENVRVVNPATSKCVRFEWVQDRIDYEELVGWEYVSTCGRFTLLIGND